MALPAGLQGQIELARDAVLRDPTHALSLGHRQAIWAALGPRVDTVIPEKVPTARGYQRRLRLAILLVRHVLPLLRSQPPGSSIEQFELTMADPPELLRLAEAVLTDPNALGNARYRFSRSWSAATDLFDPEDLPTSNVRLSAVKALKTAIEDEDFDPATRDYQLTDQDRDPFSQDASYFASVAYANGTMLDSQSNPAKRLEFWEWWLTQAVPAAWEAVPER